VNTDRIESGFLQAGSTPAQGKKHHLAMPKYNVEPNNKATV
jgi:hypothetical protein